MSEFSVSEYCIDCWNTLISRDLELDVKIEKQIASADWSECYEMDAAHVFKLSNGIYVLVEEHGCSCYSYDDASFKYYQDRDEVINAFAKAIEGNYYE